MCYPVQCICCLIFNVRRTLLFTHILLRSYIVLSIIIFIVYLTFSFVLFVYLGIDETVKMVQEIGGFCKGYVVDISRKEEVYKAAEVIRHEVGDVSIPP